MNNKASNVNFVIRLTVILVFFAIALFPMCLMALDGPDQADASMQEDKIEMKPLSVQTYFDGSFQSTFESWLSKYYPLRSKVVGFFNTTNIDVNNSTFYITIMDVLKGDAFAPNTNISGCEGQHADDDGDWVCDVCGAKISIPNLPGSTTPGDDTPSDDTPSDDTPSDDTPSDDTPSDDTPSDDTPVTPQPPVNIYLDPNNIYSKINRLQMLQVPEEPEGYKGGYGIYIGKSGYLYEKTYIDEYMGFTEPYVSVTDAGMQETVDELEYIQKELEKRGITMLYVITSSKASAYADYIPEYYLKANTSKPGYIRPIDRLRPMLAASGVNYLDSAKYYEEIGLLVTFPKTGIHWNALASFESTTKLINMYSELTGKETVELLSRGVLSYNYAPSSFNNEQDIFNILYNQADQVNPKYREEAIKDDAYYAPDIVIGNQNAPKINVLVQGGSFAHSIVYYIRNCGVGNVTQVYYNDFGNTGSDPWSEGPEAWEGILAGKDLIIFEATEQQIRGAHKTSDMTWGAAAGNGHLGHNAVYDSLYEYLKDHEGEY
ncbi:MAG: hypothetical protein E7605_06815 [Ruminococcaceae bacterium]|nr:hypothetical protein [Oscillospiraceae bacterium]